MIKIKICGITNPEDAMLAMNLGADYVGFNFFKDSPRKVSEKMAKETIAQLPGFVTPVGVFVDETLENLVKTAKKCGLKVLQLHGSETPEYCAAAAQQSALPVIKALRVADETVLAAIEGYKNSVNFLLLDACVPGLAGGTGETFNWDIALKVIETNIPFFLAGGLTPENVGEAIEKVRPFAVDTASGVERLTRRKDYDKMKNFVTNARRA